MAAGEDQAQPVVFDAFVVHASAIVACQRTSRSVDIVRQRLESGAPAHCIDGLEPAGRNEPGARIGGHAIARPLLQRRPERVVQRLFGEIEVAEQADQRGEDVAGVGAVDSVRRVARMFCHCA